MATKQLRDDDKQRSRDLGDLVDIMTKLYETDLGGFAIVIDQLQHCFCVFDEDTKALKDIKSVTVNGEFVQFNLENWKG